MGHTLDVRALLERLQRFYEIKTDVELARLLQLRSSSAVGNWRRENRISLDIIIALCRTPNAKGERPNLEWILYGEGSRIAGDAVDVDLDELDTGLKMIEQRAAALRQLIPRKLMRPAFDADVFADRIGKSVQEKESQKTKS